MVSLLLPIMLVMALVAYFLFQIVPLIIRNWQ
jgi:hypothetical protein